MKKKTVVNPSISNYIQYLLHFVLLSLCAFLATLFALRVFLSSYVYLLYLMFICCNHMCISCTLMCICCILCVFVVLLMCICCTLCVLVVICVYCCYYFRCRTAG